MKINRLIAGAVSFVLALLLYVLGYTQIFYAVPGDFLSSVRIYPVAFFALLGVFLVISALLPSRKPEGI